MKGKTVAMMLLTRMSLLCGLLRLGGLGHLSLASRLQIIDFATMLERTGVKKIGLLKVRPRFRQCTTAHQASCSRPDNLWVL